jgi:hypothetical protein
LPNIALRENNREPGRETKVGLGDAVTVVIPAAMILIDLVRMMTRWRRSLAGTGCSGAFPDDFKLGWTDEIINALPPRPRTRPSKRSGQFV